MRARVAPHRAAVAGDGRAVDLEREAQRREVPQLRPRVGRAVGGKLRVARRADESQRFAADRADAVLADVSQGREGPRARRVEDLGEQVVADARRLLLIHEEDRELLLGAPRGRGRERVAEPVLEAGLVAVLEPRQAERLELVPQEARVEAGFERAEVAQVVVPQPHLLLVRREPQREARVRVARAQRPAAGHAERRPERRAAGELEVDELALASDALQRERQPVAEVGEALGRPLRVAARDDVDGRDGVAPSAEPRVHRAAQRVALRALWHHAHRGPRVGAARRAAAQRAQRVQRGAAHEQQPEGPPPHAARHERIAAETRAQR